MTHLDALLLALAYLLGSIPFGLILTRIAGMGDIRNIGSGNIGATNVLRTGNKKVALATLVLDAGKGALAVILALCLASETTAWYAGLAAILGHIYPIWLKGKGGKGVATAAATLLALTPKVGLIAVLAWAITFAITRISSLSAISAIALSILAGWFFEPAPHAIIITLIAALVLWRHKQNIIRLLRKEEGKMGK